MIRRARPLLSSLGAQLRALTEQHWKTVEGQTDPMEIEAKAEIFLNSITPRLEAAAKRGASRWDFQYLEEYPNEGGVPEVEDEYGFNWQHLSGNYSAYQKWFAQQGLRLEARSFRTENRDAGAIHLVRELSFFWGQH
eukprot:EG_transcript_39619